jgi:hypothetical protein
MSAAAGEKEMNAAFKGALGKWDCDAKELGSGKAFKATAEVSSEFGGATFIEKYTEQKSADHAQPWSAVFLMSYDDSKKHWVRHGVDNSGGTNAATSSGWKDKTWVWENDGVNIVIAEQGPKARTFAVDVKDGGNVKRVVEANCKKI